MELTIEQDVSDIASTGTLDSLQTNWDWPEHEEFIP